MMNRERRLGRGLEALLGGSGGLAENAPIGDAAPAPAAAAQSGTKIPVSLIDPNPFQPRRTFDEDELAGLAKSLAEHGLIQPLVVRHVGGRYQLIVGERRLKAAQKLGWNTVLVRIIEADDRQVAEVAIVENLQRQDLNPLEKAAAFQEYLRQYSCPQEELAKRLGIDRSTIANLIRLLELPEKVQAAVRGGQITAGHARALLPLGEEEEQVEYCTRIQKEGLSVRTIEQLVREKTAQQDGKGLSLVTADGERVPAPSKSEHLSSLEQRFRSMFGTKVELKQTAKGAGKIVIHFGSHDEFDRLRKQLGGDGSAAPVAQAG